jgi:hypothetical protein
MSAVHVGPMCQHQAAVLGQAADHTGDAGPLDGRAGRPDTVEHSDIKPMCPQYGDTRDAAPYFPLTPG